MTAADILYSSNLKRTGCREGIINVVLKSGEALSENEIRDKLKGNYDRTTFYRSFKTLEENNIIHKIVVDNQIIKFALDNAITQKQAHPHFYCYQCHSVVCMDTLPVQTYELPNGFYYNQTEVIIKGICPFCKKDD